MKAEIINTNTKPKFEPFGVKLTIESEDELKELWHRLNLAVMDVVSASRKYGVWEYKDLKWNNWGKLWDLLDEAAKERGIKIYK